MMKMRLILYFFIIFPLAYSIFTITRILVSFHLLDFSYYHQSIQLILGNQNPYNNPNFVLNYPPSALFFFLPFGIIPYELSEKIWTLLSLAALVGSISILLKSIYKNISVPIFLVIFSLAMLSFPVKFNFGLGQINNFILLLVSLCFLLYRLKRFFWAGIFLGIASSIKIFPIILLLFFIRKKVLKTVTASILTSIIISILGIVFFGKDLTFEYYTNVLWNIPKLGNDVYYNQAFTGFLARLNLSDLYVKIINYCLFIFLLIGSFWVVKSKRQPPLIELMQYALFIISVLIGGGLAWQHHFVLLIIPFTALFIYLSKKPFNRAKILILVTLMAYFLVSINIKEPAKLGGVLTFLLSHVLYGSIILYLINFKVCASRE